MAHGAQGVGERCGLLVREIRDDPFGQDEDSLRDGVDSLQKLLALGGIGEVDSHTLQTAGRRLLPQDVFLVVDDAGKVGFDPVQIRRQHQSIGTCVEPGTETQHRIDSRSKREGEIVVDDPGAQGHGPRDDARGGHGLGNAAASLAGEARSRTHRGTARRADRSPTRGDTRSRRRCPRRRAKENSSAGSSVQRLSQSLRIRLRAPSAATLADQMSSIQPRRFQRDGLSVGPDAAAGRVVVRAGRAAGAGRTARPGISDSRGCRTCRGTPSMPTTCRQESPAESPPPRPA